MHPWSVVWQGHVGKHMFAHLLYIYVWSMVYTDTHMYALGLVNPW